MNGQPVALEPLHRVGGSSAALQGYIITLIIVPFAIAAVLLFRLHLGEDQVLYLWLLGLCSGFVI